MERPVIDTNSIVGILPRQRRYYGLRILSSTFYSENIIWGLWHFILPYIRFLDIDDGILNTVSYYLALSKTDWDELTLWQYSGTGYYEQ